MEELQGDVKKESLPAASATRKTMAMMMRLHRGNTKVQMYLQQFFRLANEKMAIDVAEINHLRPLSPLQRGTSHASRGLHASAALEVGPRIDAAKAGGSAH